MVAGQPVTPVIVMLGEAETKEVGVADILVQSLGLVGLLLAGAFVCGLLLGGLFVLFKRWRPENPLNGQTATALLRLGPGDSAETVEPR